MKPRDNPGREPFLLDSSMTFKPTPMPCLLYTELAAQLLSLIHI